MTSPEFFHERTRQLHAEYQDRIARSRMARIPFVETDFGPDWRNDVKEMIERVERLKDMLKITVQPEREIVPD